MKHLFSLFFFVMVVSTGAQTVNDAINWNDEIVAVQSVLLSYEDAFIKVLGKGLDDGFVDVAYENYLNYMKFALSYFEAKEPFDSKDIFRKAIIDLLKDFKKIAETEYAELISLYKKPADELTDSDYKRWDELIEIIDEKEIDSNNNFLKAQKNFADQYKFNLNN